MDPYLDDVRLARASMNSARVAADNAAAAYRSQVRTAVTAWKSDGLSLRKSAERLGITEGALRDLLRPDGLSRRARSAKKTEQTEGVADVSGTE
jgi:DNA-directed RNA polymerase specialized sigma24 family protein